MSRLRVAMIAPPWLKIPPGGYGGIEVLLDDLIRELKKIDVEVVLFNIGSTKIRGVKVHSLYEDEQYADIHRPMYESLPIILAHLQFALQKIEDDGQFDVIHDHNGFIGPFALNYFTRQRGIPPAIHTNHGPPFSNKQMLQQGLPNNRPFWDTFCQSNKSFIVGISETLMRDAPKSLKKCLLPPVHNALNPENFPFKKEKQNYFLTLARFSRDKGQHTAVKLCNELGLRLRMAGTVAGIDTNQKLILELANPLSDYRNAADFRYYSDKILPHTVNNRKITYMGNISGKRKLKTIANAKALLFPIDWDEPFGMAVIESLVCGTPVIAMNRGAMPEIIEHGVNGFLANNEKEFKEYMQRIDEIDPEVCRQTVVDNFSSEVMAQRYLERYQEAIKRAS